jgi:hypothetical protein
MLPRVGVGGLQASTATYFVPSVSYAIRGHSRKTDPCLPPDVASELAAKGYSKCELLALTHVFMARRL